MSINSPVRLSTSRPLVVGFPKEIKPFEHRFLGTRSLVGSLRTNGIGVLVERGAGHTIGMIDNNYRELGAEVTDASNILRRAQVLVLVKELQPAHFYLVTEQHLVFDYAHLANPESFKLLQFLLEKGITNIAFETMRDRNGFTFALHPMSVVAGAYAVDLIATKFNINLGGPGQRLEGYPGLDSVSPAKVLVLGGGTAGTSAAFQLLLRGASVFITEVKPVRIAFLSEFLGREIFDKFQTSRSLGRRNFLEIVIPKSFEEDQPNISPEIIKDLCVRADAVIGAPYIPAANAPKILTRQMRAEINAARLALGRPGLVIVDIATDQGGCVEVSEGIHSSHEYPWFQDDFGNFICNIPNMPGGFPLTSSEALAASIANPLITLAKLPFREALLKCPELIWGINTLSGMLTVKAVADFHHLSYTPVFEALQKAETGFDLVAFQQLEFGQIYQDISTGGNPDWKNITPNLLGQPCRCTFERGKTQLHFTLG